MGLFAVFLPRQRPTWAPRTVSCLGLADTETSCFLSDPVSSEATGETEIMSRRRYAVAEVARLPDLFNTTDSGIRGLL